MSLGSPGTQPRQWQRGAVGKDSASGGTGVGGTTPGLFKTPMRRRQPSSRAAPPPCSSPSSPPVGSGGWVGRAWGRRAQSRPPHLAGNHTSSTYGHQQHIYGRQQHIRTPHGRQRLSGNHTAAPSQSSKAHRKTPGSASRFLSAPPALPHAALTQPSSRSHAESRPAPRSAGGLPAHTAPRCPVLLRAVRASRTLRRSTQLAPLHRTPRLASAAHRHSPPHSHPRSPLTAPAPPCACGSSPSARASSCSARP